MTDAHTPSQPVVWFDTPTPLVNGCRCKASTTTKNERSIIVPCVETAGVDGFCPRCRVECTQPEEKAA